MPGDSIRDMRIGYSNGGLHESGMAPAPLAQFQSWFDDAVRDAVVEPNAMVLSTVDGAGNSSSRTVLMKAVTPAGITFFTNLHSAKGRAIDVHPQVSLVFPWYPLQRQVCVSGVAHLVDRPTVEEYFATRPRESQLGAWASEQSAVVSSRDTLAQAYAAAAARFPDAVPAPPHWGGLCVRVETIEFWSGQPSRLHDRLRYRRIADGGLDQPDSWQLERLSP